MRLSWPTHSVQCWASPDRYAAPRQCLTEHARSSAPDGQIPLTRNEIAGLFATLIIQLAPQAQHRLR